MAWFPLAFLGATKVGGRVQCLEPQVFAFGEASDSLSSPVKSEKRLKQ